MVKRKVIWSQKANIKLFEILDFYTKRNKNAKYSTQLFNRFKKKLSLLDKHPEMGIKTDFESVRGLIVDEFMHIFSTTLGWNRFK